MSFTTTLINLFIFMQLKICLLESTVRKCKVLTAIHISLTRIVCEMKFKQNKHTTAQIQRTYHNTELEWC